MSDDQEVEVVLGSFLIDDEANIPMARENLIRLVFAQAGREISDDFEYDLKYNDELEAFEMAVIVNVTGGGSGDQEDPLGV